MRIEKDNIGEVEIPEQALYGINAIRANKNFNNDSTFNKYWYEALGEVKKACYKTVMGFYKSIKANEPDFLKKGKLRILEENKLKSLINTANEVSEGKHYEHFIVPAIQGGAGTSINMNINEIISNASIISLGGRPGDYRLIDPFEDANIYQSTNDVIPTSLVIATIKQLNNLEIEINQLREKIETLEKTYRNVKRIAYTQMQEAVPSTYGKLFSSYNDALSRDWWRVSKCFERIKVVNLGGGATGTGMGIPRYFSYEVTNNLKKITGLPVTRSENLNDSTSNMDKFIEVHSMLNAHAVNLEKIASDIRLLASNIGGSQISIPQVQTGSSIMPGKINPVISEYVISIAHKVYSNNNLIANLSGQGMIDLNAYLPIIGDSLLNSLELLLNANKCMAENLFNGIEIDVERAEKNFFNSPTITTVLVPFIGYKKSSEISKIMKNDKISVFEANQKLNHIENSKILNIFESNALFISPFSIKDL